MQKEVVVPVSAVLVEAYTCASISRKDDGIPGKTEGSGKTQERLVSQSFAWYDRLRASSQKQEDNQSHDRIWDYEAALRCMIKLHQPGRLSIKSSNHNGNDQQGQAGHCPCSKVQLNGFWISVLSDQAIIISIHSLEGIYC